MCVFRKHPLFSGREDSSSLVTLSFFPLLLVRVYVLKPVSLTGDMANTKKKKPRRPPLNSSDLVLELDGECFPPLPSKGKEILKDFPETSTVMPMTPSLVNSETSPSKSYYATIALGNSPSLGLKLKYVENTNMDGKIRFEAKECLDLEKQWGFALIGYVGGRFPGIKALREEVAKWRTKVKIHLHPSQWIIFKFQSEEDRVKVVNGGPYHVFNRPLLIKEMPREFNFGDELIHHVPIWVQLPNLPIDYWTNECLSKIGSMIGKPVASDSLTQSREHLAYARVLVEIDISKDVNDLPKHLTLVSTSGMEFAQKVCYEYIPYFCDHCKIVGHDSKHCSSNFNGKPVKIPLEGTGIRENDPLEETGHENSMICDDLKTDGAGSGAAGPESSGKHVRRKILTKIPDAGAGVSLNGDGDRRPETASHRPDLTSQVFAQSGMPMPSSNDMCVGDTCEMTETAITNQERTSDGTQHEVNPSPTSYPNRAAGWVVPLVSGEEETVCIDRSLPTRADH